MGVQRPGESPSNEIARLRVEAAAIHRKNTHPCTGNVLRYLAWWHCASMPDRRVTGWAPMSKPSLTQVSATAKSLLRSTESAIQDLAASAAARRYDYFHRKEALRA